ncbi:MAG: SDR family oxidoreductase [Sphingomonadales bacterium]|nr:SDR family oxidoreductase [Sphingomonadales bacterium]
MFCFGVGQSARALAARLGAAGWDLAGSTRNPDKVSELSAAGYDAFVFEGETPLPTGVLAGATHILISISPGEDGDVVLARHREDIASLDGLEWVGYLSATSVYGNHDGGWVDEDTPARPSGPRGRRRAEAEQGWLQLAHDSGIPVHVFRLAGIYGPDNNPLRALKAGTAKRIVKPGQRFSRIHVDDIAAVLEASINRPNPGRIYNVADDEAAPPQDVVAHAAELLGIDPPPEIPFDSAQLSDMARSFYRDNKRVSNARIKEELGVALAYPTYREGLRALAAEL